MPRSPGFQVLWVVSFPSGHSISHLAALCLGGCVQTEPAGARTLCPSLSDTQGSGAEWSFLEGLGWGEDGDSPGWRQRNPKTSLCSSFKVRWPFPLLRFPSRPPRSVGLSVPRGGGLCSPFKASSPVLSLLSPPVPVPDSAWPCLSEPGESVPCKPALTAPSSSRNFERRVVFKGFSDQFLSERKSKYGPSLPHQQPL